MLNSAEIFKITEKHTNAAKWYERLQNSAHVFTKSRRICLMLNNEPTLASRGLDTAEKEPLKISECGPPMVLKTSPFPFFSFYEERTKDPLVLGQSTKF